MPHGLSGLCFGLARNGARIHHNEVRVSLVDHLAARKLELAGDHVELDAVYAAPEVG